MNIEGKVYKELLYYIKFHLENILTFFVFVNNQTLESYLISQPLKFIYGLAGTLITVDVGN